MNSFNKPMVLTIVLVMLFLGSCMGKEFASEVTYTPIPTVVDAGLAYGTPCKPPCWQGLIPGQATLEETTQVMEQLRDSESVYNIQDNLPWQYDVYPHPVTPAGVIHVIMKNNIVQNINSPTITFYYSIGVLIEQFGEPEGLYLVEKGSTICSSCEEWETLYPPDVPVESSPINFLYPNQGLWFLALVPVSGLGCICPEMQVVSFCYYPPHSVQEVLKDDYLANMCASPLINVSEEDLIEWHGFDGGY